MVLLHTSTRNARMYTYLAHNLSLTQRNWDCRGMYIRNGAGQSGGQVSQAWLIWLEYVRTLRRLVCQRRAQATASAAAQANA